MAEADKLTLGQGLTVRVPYSILTLMKYKGSFWLTNSRMVRYQSMLCENLRIQLEVVKTLNPVTLLLVESGPPVHDCSEVMDEVFFRQTDLTVSLSVFLKLSISQMVAPFPGT
jgi:hypothetical protein